MPPAESEPGGSDGGPLPCGAPTASRLWRASGRPCTNRLLQRLSSSQTGQIQAAGAQRSPGEQRLLSTQRPLTAAISSPPEETRRRRTEHARGGGWGWVRGVRSSPPSPGACAAAGPGGGGTAGEHAQWRPAQPLYRGGGAAVEPHCRRARGRWRGGFSASSGSWRPVGVPDGPGLRFLLPFPLTFSPGGLGTVFPQHRGPARAGAG